MNLFSKSMLGFMFLALVPVLGFSQVLEFPSVVEDDAILLNTPGGFLGDFQLGLSQTTSFNGGDGRGLFGVGITGFSNDQFRFTAFGTAEIYSLFPVEQGDAVTPGLVNFVNNNAPFVSNIDFDDQLNGVPPVGELTLEVGESVFLGYWDNNGDPRNVFVGGLGAEVGDNFGWLELSRSDRSDGTFGDLEILGGATSPRKRNHRWHHDYCWSSRTVVGYADRTVGSGWLDPATQVEATVGFSPIKRVCFWLMTEILFGR